MRPPWKRRAAAPVADVPAPPGVSDAEMRFWDCRVTKFEAWLLAVNTLIVVLLHLQPIQDGMYAQYLIMALAGLSWLTPITGFYYTACNQFLPYPEVSMFNPAQIGVITWAAVFIVYWHRVKIRGLPYLVVLLPLLIWLWVTTGKNVFKPSSDYIKCLAFALIAAQLACASRGRYLKCLLGVGLGSLMVTVAYWCFVVGLPVIVNHWGVARAGIERMGGTRADAVMVWPAILFGIGSLLGLGTASLCSPRPPRERNWLLPFGVVTSLLALPPLLSTMTTGGYVGISVLSVAYVIFFRTCFRRGEFKGVAAFRLWRYIVTGLSLLTVMIAVNAFGLQGRARAMWEYQREITRRRGIASTRQETWAVSLRTIARYPLFGVLFSGRTEEKPREYRGADYLLSHNVFLDYGRTGGIPGMLFFTWFFIYPTVKMLRQRRRQRYFAFLLLQAAYLVFFMGLSFQFYKTFWSGWMLSVMAAHAERLRLDAEPQTLRRRNGAP